jgi:hypothetical protein
MQKRLFRVFSHFRPHQRRACCSAPRRQGKSLRIENLEARMLLDSKGLLSTNDAYLTLSFADDGVQVAGQSNALAAKFDSLAPTADWQSAILRAFQTWTSLTNADIGVVDDKGLPFGTPGTDRRDKRFGDIRIAAVAMAPEIGAVSVPVNSVVGGSWTADVIFNTNFAFQSIDDLFAIALHEAGNVLGLEDSADPLSPLHVGTIPTAPVPTATDTLNLQALYGIRFPDLNENSRKNRDNNSFDNATSLRLNDYSSEGTNNPFGDGSAPSLAYGDISTIGDVDHFSVEIPHSYAGPVTIRVRSAGISLLAPQLDVYDEQQQLVQQANSTSVIGDVVTITLPHVTEDSKYFIQIEAASADWRAVGGYSLVVTFDGINQVSPEIVGRYSDSCLRKLGQEELRIIFDADQDDSFHDDFHTNDDPSQAIPLESESGFAAPTRFETIGSITDGSDLDFYRIKSPDVESGFSVLTIVVRSLETGTVVPQLTVLDHHKRIVAGKVLANGAGQLVVQISGISPNETYYVMVASADPVGPFASGNYQLTASFGGQATNLQQFAGGALSARSGQNVHTLYVAEPQLLHFLLEASADVPNDYHVVIASIYKRSGGLAHRIGTLPGDTRSSVAVLLAPGTYEIVVNAVTLAGPSTLPISYQFLGLAISDHFVSDPDDPTKHPFYNPDPSLGGAYLYPGGIPSDDPYLWDDFIASLPELPPSLPLPELVSMLLSDWWPWFWAQIGVAGPPLAVADSYTTGAGAPLNVSTDAGVLSNDIEPDGTPMGVIMTSAPRSGQLTFNSDGSFQYIPAPGFNGMVRFTYQVTDFSQMSAEQTVTIAVGLQADYDGNGTVDQLDYAVWRANFGSTTNLGADGNGDGRVDIADYVLWRINRVSAVTPTGADALASSTQAVAAVIDSTTELAAVPSTFLFPESGLTSANIDYARELAFEDMGLLDLFMSEWRIPPRLAYER